MDQVIEFVRGRDTMLEMARRYDTGEISHDEYLLENFTYISSSDMKQFLRQHPPETLVDPGLTDLLNVLSDRKIAYYVVSLGLKLCISHALSPFEYQPTVVYANDYDYDNERLLLHAVNKDHILKSLREQHGAEKQVFFVGDGTSDISAVDSGVPDRVFVKRGFSLERHCHKIGLEHTPFSTLSEVAEYLRNTL